MLRGKRTLKAREMAVLCRQMETLFRSGVPVLDIVKSVFVQSPNTFYQTIGREIAASVERGESLKSALTSQGKVFPPFFTGMVALGEETGTLAEILKNLSQYYHRDYQWREQLRTALLYPATIGLVALGITVVLVFFVLPNFAEIYGAMNIPLPSVTRFIMGLGGGVRTNPTFFVLVLGGHVAGLTVLSMTQRGRSLKTAMLQKLPVVGNLSKKILLGRFCRTLALLLKNGVPLWDGLDLSAELLPHPLLQKEVAAARDGIWEGQAMAVPLQKGTLFPPYVRQMLGIGELSGNLEEMLDKVADLCEYETEQLLSRAVALLEPMLVLGLAGGVGTVVVSLILPMFNTFNLIN